MIKLKYLLNASKLGEAFTAMQREKSKQAAKAGGERLFKIKKNIFEIFPVSKGIFILF